MGSIPTRRTVMEVAPDWTGTRLLPETEGVRVLSPPLTDV